MNGVTCTCGRIHAAAEVVAVGRFSSGTRFQAASGGPTRTTRAEAQRDVCPDWTAS
jgi:hypothetical protein